MAVAAQQLGRRTTRDLTRLVNEVRLVVVAGTRGNRAPRESLVRAPECERPLEPCDAVQLLRRQTDVVAKELLHATDTEACLASDGTHSERVTPFGDERGKTRESRVDRTRQRETPRQNVDDPVVPRSRCGRVDSRLQLDAQRW